MLIKCISFTNKCIAQMCYVLPAILYKSILFLNAKPKFISMPDSSTCIILNFIVRRNVIIIDSQNPKRKVSRELNKMNDQMLVGVLSFVDLSMLFFLIFLLTHIFDSVTLKKLNNLACMVVYIILFT